VLFQYFFSYNNVDIIPITLKISISRNTYGIRLGEYTVKITCVILKIQESKVLSMSLLNRGILEQFNFQITNQIIIRDIKYAGRYSEDNILLR